MKGIYYGSARIHMDNNRSMDTTAYNNRWCIFIYTIVAMANNINRNRSIQKPIERISNER
jgi:hypothetical protein